MSAEHNVFSAVEPTVFYTKILGLCPFSVNKEELKFQTSIVGFLLVTLILGLFSGVASYTIYTRMTSGKKVENTAFLSDTNDLIQLACGVGVTVCVLAIILIQRKKAIHVVEHFHHVDKEMQTLDIKIDYSRIRRNSIIQLIILTLVILLLFVHDFVVWTLNGTIYDVFYWVTYFVPNIYNFFMEYQFITGALLLKTHFTQLNTFLMNTSENDESELDALDRLDLSLNANGWMDNVDSIVGPKILDYPIPQWNGGFSRIRTRKIGPMEVKPALTHASLGKIKTFRKIHSGLCEIKESLNSAFSLQMLASVAQAFVIITSNLYLLFIVLSDSNTSKLRVISYPIVWSCVHVVELVMLVVTCTKTSKMANHTAVVVHKLLAKECETDVRNQLKLFSIQLLHRKISFTACGFFTLDMTLLQAIIGAATTYLVILIQFHNTNKEANP